ncbi:hypothetical protein [Microbacterium sp. MYb64]|uniref:hypothetical protein n=1 Tax=Microbacterium sp. MYb64 TaxID=1848691 RepID=UPI0011B06897|nr:hypothetical protein [Microbacterium sp. MYb64]
MSDERAASPRTPKKPMAFTTEEFVNGALLAWGLTLLLLPVLMFTAMTVFGCPTYASSVSCSISDVSSRLLGAVMFAVVGAVLSIPAFLLFVFPAFALNRICERSAHPALHVAVNAILGLAVGAAGSFLALLTLGSVGLFLVAVPSALAGAIAFPLAWRFTAARALNADRGITARCAWTFPGAVA